MKSVLISIRPMWCQLIKSGEKTIEVRKTKPRCETPFKCYIYCTLPKSNYWGLCKYDCGIGLVARCNYEAALRMNMDILSGKVIGEFICDKIKSTTANNGIQTYYNIPNGTCLTDEQLIKYAAGKTLYLWHISDLKIYDKPKELSEFYQECDLDCSACNCPHLRYVKVNADEYDFDCEYSYKKPIKRPPQSWCYVEVGNDKGA